MPPSPACSGRWATCSDRPGGLAKVHTAQVTGITARPAPHRHHAAMARKNVPNPFVGPREPSLRERMAWAGIRPPSEREREGFHRWRRRQAQMRASVSR